jgi:flagellar FliJ protein
MKKFAFQFEQLLRVREFAEDEAKAELGREISALNELESRLALNEQQRGQTFDNRFSKTNSIFDMDTHNFYIMRLDNEKLSLLHDIEEQSKKVEASRERFIAASRERKIIDKMKEKRQKEYRKESLKTEEAALDDLASARRL